jgi:hypothetical protein
VRSVQSSLPLPAGLADDVQRRPVPRRGVEMLNIWKWRNPSFSRGCWKWFLTELLEMEKVEDSRDFQISKAISTDMRARPAGWTSRGASLAEGRTSNQANSVVSHPVKPALSLGIACRQARRGGLDMRIRA